MSLQDALLEPDDTVRDGERQLEASTSEFHLELRFELMNPVDDGCNAFVHGRVLCNLTAVRHGPSTYR